MEIPGNCKEITEYLNIIWEGLVNTPGDSYGRDRAIEAYGGLTSQLGIIPKQTTFIDTLTGITTINKPYTPRKG